MPTGTLVELVSEFHEGRFVGPYCDKVMGGRSWNWDFWRRRAECGRLISRIVRYRIRRPRGLIILENLIADRPAPVTPKVDA